MNKNFKFYLSIWAILFVLFNVVAFVIPRETLDGAFWTGYTFIVFAFIGQLVCGYIALQAKNLKKLFYNIPILSISWTGLVLTVLVGSICIAIQNFPTWIGIIVCFAILAFTAISVVKASFASDLIETVDEKIKTKTFFIKSLTIDAEGLLSRAKTEIAKAECKKVYETVRFSDPMSSEELNVCEAKILVKFEEFSNAISAENENISSIANELIALIQDRNRKCKLQK